MCMCVCVYFGCKLLFKQVYKKTTELSFLYFFSEAILRISLHQDPVDIKVVVGSALKHLRLF